MHPHDFKSLLDHLYDAYRSLHDEFLRLGRDNSFLAEELAKAKALNNSLSQKLHTNVISPTRLLKMGAEWCFDGDAVMPSLSIAFRFKFISPILKARVSFGGQVAFACNRFIFLFRDEKFYIVEETIRECNPADFKKDLCDFSNLFFEFNNEDLIVHSKGCILCYRNFKKLWSIPFHSILNMVTNESLLYVATVDFKIHVINYEDNGRTRIEILDIREHFKDFLVKGKDILLYTDTVISFYNKKYAKNENFNILGLDYDGGMLYYGGDSCTLKICKVNRTNGMIEVVETLIFKHPILVVKAFLGKLLVSIDDKVVNLIDYRNKKCMRMVLSENIIDIATSEDTVLFVDNSGGLRVWKCKNNELLKE